MSQLVEALRYKPEGRGFRFPMVSLGFFINIIYTVALLLWGNEYQENMLGGKGGRCVGLTTLPPSVADCLEICEPQTSGKLRDSPGL